MTSAEIERFMRLRSDLFDALKVAFEEDGHGKTYEGAFGIRLPNYFEESGIEQIHAEEKPWQITLDCYKIGPNRHYHWDGATFLEALDACEKDVRRWIAGDDDD